MVAIICVVALWIVSLIGTGAFRRMHRTMNPPEVVEVEVVRALEGIEGGGCDYE